MKPSEMVKGKRYRVVLEATVTGVQEGGVWIQKRPKTPSDVFAERFITDRDVDVVSVEEIEPEYPVGTVAIHRGDTGGVYVYRKFRDNWYDMGGQVAEWYSVTHNVLGKKSVQYVLPEDN